MTVGPVTLKAGDIITIDGAQGQVLQGRVPMIEPELTGEFATLMEWADKVRKLGVRANADTPRDAPRVEMRQQRQNVLPAGSGQVADLRHRDRPVSANGVHD